MADVQYTVDFNVNSKEVADNLSEIKSVVDDLSATLVECADKLLEFNKKGNASDSEITKVAHAGVVAFKELEKVMQGTLDYYHTAFSAADGTLNGISMLHIDKIEDTQKAMRQLRLDLEETFSGVKSGYAEWLDGSTKVEKSTEELTDIDKMLAEWASELSKSSEGIPVDVVPNISKESVQQVEDQLEKTPIKIPADIKPISAQDFKAKYAGKTSDEIYGEAENERVRAYREKLLEDLDKSSLVFDESWADRTIAAMDAVIEKTNEEKLGIIDVNEEAAKIASEMERQAKMAEDLHDAYASAFGAQNARVTLKQEEEQKNAAKKQAEETKAAAKAQKEEVKAAAKAQEDHKKRVEDTIKAAKQLVKVFKKVGSAILSASKEVGKMALSLAKGPLFSMGGGMFSKILKAAGIVGLGALFKEASESASDLTKSVTLVNSLFGENSKAMHEWADSQALYFGVSRLEAEKYFGEVGEYLNNTNIDANAAAVIAKNLTAKSGEIARSFAGMSVEDAQEKLYKVISSARPKQAGASIGLNLSEEAFNAELLAEGINKTYKELDEADKVIIRYNTAMRQLGAITGSTASETDNWDGALASLTANAKDALSSLGLILQHYLLPVVQVLNQIMAALAQSLRSLVTTMGIELPSSAGNAADAIEGVGDAATGAGKDAEVGLAGFDKLNNLSESKGGGGGTDLSELANTIKPLDSLTDNLKKPIKSLKEMLKTLKDADWSKAGEWVGKAFNKVLKKTKKFTKSLKEFNLGKKIADFLNGAVKEIDFGTLGSIFGDLFGSWQDSITGFLTTFDFTLLGSKLGSMFDNFDFEENMSKLGTNLGLIPSKIAALINGFFEGEEGEKRKEEIKEGVKSFLSSAIENFNASDIGEALGNLADTIGRALTGAAEGMDGLGSKLAETLEEAIKTGGIKNLAKGIADFVLAASKEIGEFLTSDALFDCAKEILSGIKEAIVENPEGAQFLGSAIATVLATKAVLKIITSHASDFFKSNPVAIPLTILVTGLAFLWSEKAKQDATLEGIQESSAEYMAKEPTIDIKYVPAIEKDEAKFRSDLDTMMTYYKSIMKDYTLIGEDKKDYAIGGDTIVQWLFGDLDEAQASQYIKDKLPAIEMDLQKLIDDGVEAEDLDVAMSIIKKIKSQPTFSDNDMLELQKLAGDLGSELISIYGNGIATADNLEVAKGMGNITDAIKNSLTVAGDAIEAAPKLSDEVNDLSESLSSDAFQSENTSKILDLLDNMGSDSDTAQKKMDKLNSLLSPFIINITNLSKACGELDSILPPTTEKLSNFLDLYEKISSQHWDGKLIDNSGLQSNVDSAVGIVQTAAKDIDDAIANSTNLRNFEATLSSTQTIKVDSSGTMNFKFDVTTKPDKDAFNSWQEKYTKANKALNG